MKILFITGCIEPARSGVADYTRMLAEACAGRGHSCELISLNDPFVKEVTMETLKIKEMSIAETRIPAGTLDRNRLEILGERLKRFAPDWVSLQFVTYAFQSRGLIWPKLRALAGLLRSWKVHIMFHELWIGAYQNAPWKERFVGSLQKWMLKRFVEAIMPRCAHTSTPLYQSLLKDAGINAELLPMFGTIAVDNKCADAWLFPLLQNAGVSVDSSTRASYWLVGVFGSIHPHFPYREVIPELLKAASALGRKAVAISIGNGGPGASLWERMDKEQGCSIQKVALGRLPESDVSQLLNSLDIGVTSTPLDIVGKSSSVAAMLDHGLPVLVPELGKSGWMDSKSLPGVFTSDQFFHQRKYAESYLKRHRCSLDESTDQFLGDLYKQSTEKGLNEVLALS